METFSVFFLMAAVFGEIIVFNAIRLLREGYHTIQRGPSRVREMQY